MRTAGGGGSEGSRDRAAFALLPTLAALLLAPGEAFAWPDPACELPDYEEVIGGPSHRLVPGYLQRVALGGVEENIFVTRISGDPGAPVGPAAPGKVWPSVVTHRYSLVDPCNADDSMCLLDVGRDCEDLGSPGAPVYDCSDASLGQLVINSETLLPILELSNPGGDEDRRWDPIDPARLIYVNQSGELGHLDVGTDAKTPLRNFGADYADLELGGGGSKSNPSKAGDLLALRGQRRFDGQFVCFAYDLFTDLKGPDIVTEEDTWCGMSRLGEILTIYFRGGSSRPGQLDAYDLDGNLLTSFPEDQHPSHWDFTIIDPLGAAIEHAVGRQKISGDDPQIVRSLTTGAIIELDSGFGWSHTSSTNEPGYDGWSIVSQQGDDGRIGLVRHLPDPDGGSVTKFVAFTRSDKRAGEGSLESLSEPTCADFGRRRILCASNWHSMFAGGAGVAAFVWDLGYPCRNLPLGVWSKLTLPSLSRPVQVALVLLLALAGAVGARSRAFPGARR